METVSAAVVGVAASCEGVAVGGAEVAVGGAVVLVGVGVNSELVAVGKAEPGVCVAVGREAPCLISNERIEDHAPLVPPAVRPRTRHQKRPSIVKVCEVWVCVSPLLETTSGALNDFESSIWISYVAAPAAAFHEKVMLWLGGSFALFAGLTRVGAAGGAGVGEGVAAVEFIKTFNAGFAPTTCRAISGLPSLLKSPATSVPPLILD